jgi:hypothetical protein
MKIKERLRNQPPLTPPYPRRGILGLPSSDKEARGVVGHHNLGARPGLCHRKTAEQSENVYENKGPAQKEVSIPGPRKTNWFLSCQSAMVPVLISAIFRLRSATP